MAVFAKDPPGRNNSAGPTNAPVLSPDSRMIALSPGVALGVYSAAGERLADLPYEPGRQGLHLITQVMWSPNGRSLISLYGPAYWEPGYDSAFELLLWRAPD